MIKKADKEEISECVNVIKESFTSELTKGKGFIDEEVFRPDEGLEKTLKNLEEEERKI